LQKYAAILWIITLAILVSGCVITTPDPKDIEARRSMATADAVLGPPMDVVFDFPMLPKLGEESELTFILKFNKITFAYQKMDTKQLSNCNARLDFFWTNTHGSYSETRISSPVPISEVVVSGQTTWEGDAQNGIYLNCTIKIPREGIWRVQGTVYKSSTSGEDQAFIWGEYWLTVKDGISISGLGNSPKPALSSKLNTFLFGNYRDQVLEDSNDAVVVILDIAKAPLVGETVQVTCTIASLFNVAGFFMHSEFRRRDGTRLNSVSAASLLVEGNLVWNGDLKAHEPVVVTATIQIPAAGQWEISVNGNSQSRELKHNSSYYDSLELNIGDNQSSYGWE
jgi:hypothetical protein